MSLGLIPSGSVIEDTYWAVPTTYGTSGRHESFISATRAALTRRDEIREVVRESYPSNWKDRDQIAKDAAKVGCVVELRWVIRHPNGDKTDTSVERTNVDHLTHEHCDRVEARA